MHFSTFLLTLFSSAALSAPLAPRAATSSRAIWLWDSDLIKDSTSLSTFLSDVTNPNYGISKVHALIDRDMGTSTWTNFVSKCNVSGISVSALMGDSQWILGSTTDGGPTLDHELTWLKQYQASAPANAKFSGVHLDIEPWGLDNWSSNQATYVSTLLTLVDEVKNVASPLNLPVAVDLPFWANTVSCQGSTLDVCVLKHVDTTTFMTYRNTAVGLLAVATPLLVDTVTKSSGKPVWLSVETSPNVADAGLISYAGKSVSTLMSDLQTVENTAKTLGGFAGIAIHSYKEFKELISG
ncbi:hypothetical protein P280DRAFT_466584 [Massarina eburnea CBS 473.64]|uniref:Glycoside hydrolase n=1 Tax=Massarina eburnea CBS 473.64 TaxID=1395130 RepID=A0A6A6SBR0_9PLEO|nr:hypothetical protein P280DRAFT_466584 [Massarina eburnea CBS 473.64]